MDARWRRPGTCFEADDAIGEGVEESQDCAAPGTRIGIPAPRKWRLFMLWLPKPSRQSGPIPAHPDHVHEFSVVGFALHDAADDTGNSPARWAHCSTQSTA